MKNFTYVPIIRSEIVCGGLLRLLRTTLGVALNSRSSKESLLFGCGRQRHGGLRREEKERQGFLQVERNGFFRVA